MGIMAVHSIDGTFPSISADHRWLGLQVQKPLRVGYVHLSQTDPIMENLDKLIIVFKALSRLNLNTQKSQAQILYCRLKKIFFKYFLFEMQIYTEREKRNVESSFH